MLLNTSEDYKNVLLAILGSHALFILCLISNIIVPNYDNVSGGFVSYYYLQSAIYCAFLIYFLPKQKLTNLFVFSRTQFGRFLLILGITLVIFKCVDKIILRPPENFFNMRKYRMAKEGSSNIFSVCSVLIGYSLPFLLQVGERMYRIKISKYIKSVCKLACLIHLLDLILVGSRGIAVLYVLCMFPVKMKFRNSFILFVSVASLSCIWFIFRTSWLHNIDQDRMFVHMDHYLFDGYSRYVPISNWAAHYFSTSSAYQIVFGFCHIIQYITHGFFEYAYVFQNNSYFNLSIGHITPHLNISVIDNMHNIHKGLYYSLNGSMHLSFGLCSVLFIPVVSYFHLKFYTICKALYGHVSILPCLIIAITPYVNSFGGYDIYIIIVCSIIASKIAIK